MEQHGLWFDGQVALERPVSVSRNPGGLDLTDAQGLVHQVETSDLVRIAGSGDRLKFGHRAFEGWRLTLLDPLDPAIVECLPKRAGSLAPTISKRTIGILVAISATATALVATVIFAPQLVADHMPMSWERKLGAIYDLPVKAARCDDQAAQAALNAIVDRLDPNARKETFAIQLLDVNEANAAALPGGRMVVFNGLFDDIVDPDALAGIVAHEIAHVRRRHVAAAMIRDMGLGTVVTLVGGGAVASNAGGLVSLKFTRSAEAEADADAISMLKQAGIDPRPTAKAFDEFREQEGDWPEWLGSHPASKARALRFAASYRTGSNYRPVLDRAQAKALMRACRS